MFTLGRKHQHAVAVVEQVEGFNAREDPISYGDLAGPLGSQSPTAQAVMFRASYYTRGKGGRKPSEVSNALTHDRDKGDNEPLVFQPRFVRNGRGAPSDIVPALNGADAGETSDMRPVVLDRMVVRRLTITEQERLQGFEDFYTRVPYRGRLMSNTACAQMLGNSMPVPMIRWLGERIEKEIRRISP